jgi:dTDP-4-dehydrorhamnose 3,5-epimerase/reductase
MDAAKFLIIGANGQLGQALQAKYPAARAVDVKELDITDWRAVDNYTWDDIEVILNGAAYTNVDGAETAEGRVAAWKVNAQAVGYLAKIAAAKGLTLVHISTDYVFDGSRDNHKEDEPFSPLGVYAQAKAAGDIAVSIAGQHYILRTSWLIGEGHNFVKTMIGLAAKDISPEVVADQIGRLTFAPTLVGAIDYLLNSRAEYGTYNVTNSGPPASWADIARQIFAELGRNDLKVLDTTTAEYTAGKPDAAPRPLKSTLDLSKIEATGLKLANWQAELSKYIKEHS